MTTSRRSLILVLALGALWGLPYALTKLALTSIPPMTLVAARISLAAFVLWIVVLSRKRQIRRDFIFIRQLFVQGLIACVIPYALISFGQQTVSSALTAILNSSTPLFLCVLGPIFVADERITGTRWLGVLVGFAGVMLIAGVSAFGSVGDELVGQAAILLATLSSAVSLIYGRRFKDSPPELVATGTLTAAALMTAPVLFFGGDSLLAATPSAVAALVCNAVVATALGFVIYFRLIDEAGPVSTSSVGYLKPAVGVLIGVGVLGEGFSWTMLAGFVAVLFGVALILNYNFLSRLGRLNVPRSNARLAAVPAKPATR